jgi:shikimate kinase
MNLKLKRTPGIYIIGFMGSGKTTVGRLLAEEIGWRFADLDDDIEHSQRRSITEIFTTSGEEEFRRIEHEAIQNRIRCIRRGAPTVLALGGGAFTRADNIELLRENGITVWIDVDFEVARKRVQACERRPLARDPERFERLYNERRAFYSQAEYHVPVHTNDSKVALAGILKLNLLD